MERGKKLSTQVKFIWNYQHVFTHTHDDCSIVVIIIITIIIVTWWCYYCQNCINNKWDYTESSEYPDIHVHVIIFSLKG